MTTATTAASTKAELHVSQSPWERERDDASSYGVKIEQREESGEHSRDEVDDRKVVNLLVPQRCCAERGIPRVVGDEHGENAAEQENCRGSDQSPAELAPRDHLRL